MKAYNKNNTNFVPNNPSPLSSPLNSQDKSHSNTNSKSKDNCSPDVKVDTTPINNDIFEYNNVNIKETDNEEDDEIYDNKSVPPEFFNRLRTFALFQNAPKSFHAKVVAKLKLMQYHPQEYIIKKGDPSKSMYWILKGTVSVTSTDGESVYAELASGSYFGEIGILFNRPRTATVVARTKVLVGVLRSDALNVVLKSYPLIERRIRDEAQERLAMQDKKNKFDFPSIISKANNFNPIDHGVNASEIANASDQIPGPSLPPVRPSQISRNSDNVDSTVSIQDFIKHIPIFENLPSSIIHQMALGAEPLVLKAFEYIFHKGDIGSDIYFIVNGELEVTNFHKDNPKIEKILARLEPGSYFGEMSFLSFLNKSEDYTRSANIRTISSVELIVIKSGILENLCNKYPYIIEHMRKTAKERNELNTLQDDHNRLSISYLINGEKANQQMEESALFSSNWSFTQPSSDNTARSSRSVSPISFSDEDNDSRSPIVSEITHKRKREAESLIHLPPLNPVVPSLKYFQNFQGGTKQSFQYIPHNKRSKLANIQRRRSSVLSYNSPLPDKILLKVFSYLTLPELMRLRILSKRWRQLLMSASSLCTTLDLTPWNTSINDKALISITDFVGSRPQYINISNCFHIGDESFSYMVNEIGISGKIKVLKMKSNWEVSAMAIMDLTVPSVGEHLEEIDLSNCRKVRDSVIERLIGSSGTQVGTDQYGCSKLKILNVGYCKHLTDNVMYHISNHANSRLESLDLTRCTTITDRGFEYWSFQSFPNLKKLSLKDCTFLTDKAVVAIANAACNLEILDLNFCCALSDIAIEVLCLGCQNLRELDLSFCGSAVSDSSLVTISLHLRNLQKLILKGCIRVTRAGIDALLGGCCPLNYINVSQCKNAHVYPGRIPAQKLNINPETKSAFVTEGPNQNIIEIVI